MHRKVKPQLHPAVLDFAPSARWPSRLYWLALVAVIVGAVVAEAFAKTLVDRTVEAGEAVNFGPITIIHLHNSGVAFGLFRGSADAVAIPSLVLLITGLVWFARAGARHPLLPIALGLLLGGTLANFLDRVRFGHVVDYVNLASFSPAFNLADAFILTGFAALLLAQARLGRQRPAALEQP